MATSEQKPPRIVETASATTDPDNANSGGFAYVIAGVAIVAALGVGAVLRGCVGLTSDILQDVHENASSSPDFLDDGDPIGQDLDDWWNDRENGMDDAPITDDGSGPTVTQPVADLIGTNLAMFGHTLDASLPASDYANAEPAVSGYVRELVVTDKLASTELATELRNAAWGDDDLGDALKAQCDKADATIETIRGMSMPASSGPRAAEVADELEDARDKAVERWERVKEELEVLAGAEELSMSDIADLEDDVTEATDEAAKHLSAALKASADR